MGACMAAAARTLRMQAAGPSSCQVAIITRAANPTLPS
jgi:hypothetical protein